jgi:hypothetical protein
MVDYLGADGYSNATLRSSSRVLRPTSPGNPMRWYPGRIGSLSRTEFGRRERLGDPHEQGGGLVAFHACHVGEKHQAFYPD